MGWYNTLAKLVAGGICSAFFLYFFPSIAAANASATQLFGQSSATDSMTLILITAYGVVFMGLFLALAAYFLISSIGELATEAYRKYSR